MMSILVIISGCAYYNYFYNAQKSYEDAEKKMREESPEAASRRGTRGSSQDYQKVIDSAGRMLEFYPDSRWEDDALMLLAKAYYRIGKYRNAIGKVDELTAKYPQSEHILTGQLWKGMSLLKVSQPDSARQILTALFHPDVPVLIKSQALYALADDYYEQERWDPALIEFRKLLDLEFKDDWMRAQALIKIGECMNRLDLRQEALDLYAKILTKKQTRQLQFAATLQHSILLRDLGKHQEALDAFNDLARDAAFQDQFPRIELESARCERLMGRYDDARKRLEKLIATESKGMVAAEANYELGLLLWENWRDYAGAVNTFSQVRNAERNSERVDASDSLRKRVEFLSRAWMNLRFVQLQLSQIDSARNEMAELMPSDTTFIDSVSLALQQKSKKSRSDRISRRDDPLRKMVEEARKAEASKDSTGEVEAVADSTAPLDSTALENLLNQRLSELTRLRFDLGSFYLFEPQSWDSAEYYFRHVIREELDNQLKAQTLSSLAYIARSRGDTTRHDSLLSRILDRGIEDFYSDRTRKILQIKPTPSHQDTLENTLRDIENLWIIQKDTHSALDEYLQVAAELDSGSDHRGRALMAAAYILRREIGIDSTARAIYKGLIEEFKGREIGRRAQSNLAKLDFSQPGAKDTARFEKDIPRIDDLTAGTASSSTMTGDSDFFGDGLYPYDDDLQMPEDRIYTPDQVDMLPEMITDRATIAQLTASFFPFEAQIEGIKGTVELEFVVSSFGEITDIEVISEDPEGSEFGDAARRVLQSIMYQPGRYHGMPVSVRIKQRFAFEPEDSGK